MKRILVLCTIIAMAAAVPTTVRASELGQEIDLTTFGQVAESSRQSSVWNDEGVEEVGFFDRASRANRRFYASGMIGPQFLGITESSVLNQTFDSTVFSAGGAAGVAFDRRRGYLRLELEGMWRDDGIAIADNGGTPVRLAANNGWSVMQNVWRDILITDRFGVYGGGSLGGGGYTLGVDAASQRVDATFAWQFGGGLIYELTDRLTFDVGYRYFQINDVTNTTPIGDLTTRYGASELMFTLRLYDPLRRWRQ